MRDDEKFTYNDAANLLKELRGIVRGPGSDEVKVDRLERVIRPLAACDGDWQIGSWLQVIEISKKKRASLRDLAMKTLIDLARFGCELSESCDFWLNMNLQGCTPGFDDLSTDFINTCDQEASIYFFPLRWLTTKVQGFKRDDRTLSMKEAENVLASLASKELAIFVERGASLPFPMGVQERVVVLRAGIDDDRGSLPSLQIYDLIRNTLQDGPVLICHYFGKDTDKKRDKIRSFFGMRSMNARTEVERNPSGEKKHLDLLEQLVLLTRLKKKKRVVYDRSDSEYWCPLDDRERDVDRTPHHIGLLKKTFLEAAFPGSYSLATAGNNNARPRLIEFSFDGSIILIGNVPDVERSKAIVFNPEFNLSD